MSAHGTKGQGGQNTVKILQNIIYFSLESYLLVSTTAILLALHLKVLQSM